MDISIKAEKAFHIECFLPNVTIKIGSPSSLLLLNTIVDILSQ